MDAAEIDDYLADGGTGVLSLARGDDPYSIPVSFGYDDAARAFYLRLGFGDAAAKRPFLEASSQARLVVYDGDPEVRSVVAAGDLIRVPKGDLTPDVVAQLSEARLPAFDLWEEEKADLAFEIYRLDPETLSGRTASR